MQLLDYAKELHRDSRKDKMDDDSSKEHIDGRNVCYLVSYVVCVLVCNSCICYTPTRAHLSMFYHPLVTTAPQHS